LEKRILCDEGAERQLAGSDRIEFAEDLDAEIAIPFLEEARQQGYRSIEQSKHPVRLRGLSVLFSFRWELPMLTT
jgi:hypothetical protein